MSHPAVRVIVFLLAVACVGAGGYLLVALEDTVVAERGAERVFESQAHEAAVLVERLRTAQQSYVAEGQGADYWMGKLTDARASLERTLGSLATTRDGRARAAGRASRARLHRPAHTSRRAGANLLEAGTAADGVGPDLHRDQRHDGRDRAAHRPGAHGTAHGLRRADRGAQAAAAVRASAVRPRSACCARCCSCPGAGPRPPRTRETHSVR